MPQTAETVLEVRNIVKEYPGVVALNNVSLDFRKGEVHALVGENGAGKSTLIKTIAGAITPTKGTILCGGQEYTAMTPALSRSMGIEVVYQEFNLVEQLSAGENVCLGERISNFYDKRKVNAKAKAIFDSFHMDINPNTLVRDLPSALQQIVEIAKSVSKDVKILILDEPTAPLTVDETEILFEIIRDLKAKGVTIIYISHRLDEIFTICDRVSVLRDGQFVKSMDISENNRAHLISLMVGREMTETYPQRNTPIGEVTLKADHIVTPKLKDISIEVHKGEILGLSGLVGAGRTELARAIYGADPKTSGDIYINGQKVDITEPFQAIQFRIGLIPEDRKHEGVFLNQTIKWNTSINNIKAISRKGVVNRKEESRIADKYKTELNIVTPSVMQTVGNLSGGNQQKVVIAKTLASDSEIIIFDEPTRGIDVGARYEIYVLMNKLVAEGKSIIMITSDMEELLGMYDRIVVLCEGEYACELQKDQFSQEAVLELASGNH